MLTPRHPPFNTRWLDARIREVAKREEAAERLAAEYQRRMALLKTKEDLEQARVRFFSTHRGGGLGATSTMATMATTTTTPRAMAAATTVRDVILLSQDALGAHGHGQEEGEGMGEGGGVEGVGPAPLTPEEEATLEELEGRIAACKVGSVRMVVCGWWTEVMIGPYLLSSHKSNKTGTTGVQGRPYPEV